MWIGDTVYFRSDRDGEYNVFAYDTESKEVRADYQAMRIFRSSATSTGARTHRLRAGRSSCTCSIRSRDEARRCQSASRSDLREFRPRFVKGAKYVREAALSPTGARAVFDFRGEIVTVPGEKGDVRNLTNSVAASTIAARRGRLTASSIA